MAAPRTTANKIASQCLAVRARLLSRSLTAVFEEELAPLGITASQFNVLVLLTKLGPTRVADIGELLALEKSTLSRNAARMQKRGWIDSRPAREGRGRELLVTAAGEALLVEARPRWARAQRRAEALLGKRGTSGLMSAARAIWGA